MTTLTAPVAKQRCRKTRTKNVNNSMEPLVLSKLPMNVFELAAGREHMICPSCRTWCPITGMGEKGTPKLVPHHTEPAGTEEPRRCRGSNRLVKVDVSVDKWRRYRAEGAAQTDCRRATRVLRKPKVAPPVPVDRVLPATPTPESTLQVYLTHRGRCTSCGEGDPCTDGRRLIGLAAHLKRVYPDRAAKLAAVEQVLAELKEQRERAERADRPQQWEQVLPAVNAADRQRSADQTTGTVVGPIKSLGIPLGKGTNVGRKGRRMTKA